MPSEKEEDDSQGAARPSDADFAHFLDFALGSAFEVETQLKIAKNVGYFKNLDVNKGNVDKNNLDVNVDDKGELTYEVLVEKLHSIERLLNGLITSIRKDKP